MDPAGRRYLEVCCSDTGCYRNQGCHREPVGKEENPSPKNAKRCDTGDQKRHHINPAAQFMDRRTFWPHHNQSTDSKCDHASDKMHPPERQKIEVHNLRPGSHPCVTHPLGAAQEGCHNAQIWYMRPWVKSRPTRSS